MIPQRTALKHLSDKQILTHVAKGLTMKDIALKSGYSFRTLETRFGELMSRYRARNKAHMVFIAIKKGLIEV
jgi:DNA-binding NarL/FixJ family response regulator